MKLVGPLYQRQNPAQSGGVAVVVGTRVVSPFVKRKKKHVSRSPISAEQVAVTNSAGGIEGHESLGTIPHANAPAPQLIPTAKSAIGAPKPKPLSAEELLAAALGPERKTTVGVVIRK
jgi:hypothetical protein